MSSKIGFWSVFAIVTGSQIGSGVFMSPSTLAPYGVYGLLGWLVSGIGALALAFVFAKLCSRYPKTGGPHVYVNEAFGASAAFFVGWTYWVVSFVSSTAVIVTSIGYLSPFLPLQNSVFYLVLELLLLFLIVWLNLKGVKAAGNTEFFLTLLKFLPLLLLPGIALFFFDASNLVIDEAKQTLPLSKVLGHVTLLTLWGFIGLESATTPAGSVENPSKTIPKAILLGTATVAVVYLFSSLGIMGLIPGSELAQSKAPYVDATRILLGGQWHYVVSIIASVVCIGTLNAWVLTSGQIALGLAEDGYLPKRFALQNKNEAPFWGLLFSGLGIVPLLFLTNSSTFAEQVTSIIDISVISFLFVYIACCLGFLKLLWADRHNGIGLDAMLALVALGFCLFIVWQTPIQTLAISSLFTLCGLPVYWFWRKRTS